MSAGAKRAEALLNEYKGNIYEYLVASELARSGGDLAAFMKSVPQGFYGMLEQQESFIREFYPRLLTDLPVLAQGLASKIAATLRPAPFQVQIVGKSAAAFGGADFGEADIVVLFENGSRVPVSVKLSKAQAFVNTKSAGIKSFVGKYFKVFPECAQAQEDLGAFFDREFDSMAYALHEKAGIEFDSEFSEWSAAGLSRLPGELPQDLREIFLQALYNVNNKLYEILLSFKNSNDKLFALCLGPLTGYSRNDLVQAATFYRSAGDGYKLDSHVVELACDFDGKKPRELVNREGTSSFDVVFDDRILQIRLKAMNRFTSKGFKVNCAVKSF